MTYLSASTTRNAASMARVHATACARVNATSASCPRPRSRMMLAFSENSTIASDSARTSEIDAILLILAVIQIVAGAATWGAAL